MQDERPVRVTQKSDLPYRSEDEQRDFFHRSLERALAAEKKAGVVKRYFKLAGSVLQIDFAGRRMVQLLTRALAHLEVPAVDQPDAVFHVWDSESTDVSMLPPPCTRDCFTGRGDIWGMGSERFRSAFHWGEAALALMDVEAGTAIYWTYTANTLPYWAKASPLRTLFHWWMEAKGCHLMHAAAVGNGDGAALITGRGGLGKSTTALSCLTQGLQYIGDDYLVVELDPSPRAHSLYCTAKLNWDQLARFPSLLDLAEARDGADDEKAVLYLHPLMDRLIARSLPLKAVMTPRIVEQARSALGPVSATSLRRAAAFTTMSQLPHAGARAQEFVARMITDLPGLQLDLGLDLAAVPKLIESVLGRPAGEIATMARAVRKAGPSSPPLVSVIIPAGNGARFLSDTVGSIRAQNYPAIDIIVVDDGSSDGIADAIACLPPPVSYIRQHPSGPLTALNRGIRAATGEFVAFVGAGDVWPPGSLGAMVDEFTRLPSRDVVQGYAQLLRLSRETGQYEFVGGPCDNPADYLGTGLFRRSAFGRVGMLDESLAFGGHSDWFNRAMECGLEIGRLEQVTLHIRRHGRNLDSGEAGENSNVLRALKVTLDRRRLAPGGQNPKRLAKR